MISISFLDTDVFLDNRLFRAALLRMPEDRQEKINRFRFDKDKRLSLGAGVLLDLALHSVGLDAKNTVFQSDPQGKPFLRDHPALCFNLSHSGHYAACSLTDQKNVGIDVERIGQETEPLLRKVCTPKERAYLLSLAPMERTEQFFRLWTVKESFMKLLGMGLSLSPDRLEMDFATPPSVCMNGSPQPVYFSQWKYDEYWLTLCSELPCTADPVSPTKEELEERYGIS